MKEPALGCQRTHERLPGTQSENCKRKVPGGVKDSEAGSLGQTLPRSPLGEGRWQEGPGEVQGAGGTAVMICGVSLH